MAGQAGLGFGGLLRQLRDDAGLTQEELAGAARVSQRAVSDLERGINRTARKDTALLLAGALGLDGPARDLFVAAARGREPAEAVLAARHGGVPGAFVPAAVRSLPRDIAAFTGRQVELDQLTGTLPQVAASGGVVGIHAIDGMAGVGKTTFAVYAAHRLAEGFPDGQFFLPLHAHTAGQRPVDPADAVASLLLAVGVAAAQIPPGLEARAARWRDHLAGRRILLVLDDAAGHEQVRPLLPGTAGSLVLITSRRRLTALEDAAVISLDILPAGEAAALLARLAARPGIHAGDPAVGEITRLCGYLPLAIGMLASQLRHHPAWSPAALAASLAAARDRLALMRAENLSVAAAFDLSYADLTPGQQRLFRRLGLVPGPSIDAYTAAALDDTSLATARRHLDELYEQHLLAEPAQGRYVLHDLLREHARALAAADHADENEAATTRLLDYYLHAAGAAGRHFCSYAGTYRRLPPGRPPAGVPDLSSHSQAGAWLEAERPNLHAAVDHAAAGRRPHAWQIPAAMSGFLAARGPWNESGILHQIALAAAQESGDRSGQAIALCELGVLTWLTGDYPSAAAHDARAAALYGDIGDLADQARALSMVGFVQGLTGDRPAATATYQRALALARRARDRMAEADVLNSLGEVQHMTGDSLAAIAGQELALSLHREAGNRHGQALVLNDLAVIQEETRDYLRSAVNQQQALQICRDVGDRLGEAVALNGLGVVQRETGDYKAADDSHRQALAIFRDFGHRLGEAEALNRLGELSSRTSATGQARERHTRALALARNLGVPFEEARALEGLGQAHLQDGDHPEALAYLGQALSIYQRIGVMAARRTEETLHRHGLLADTAHPRPVPPSEHNPPGPPAAPTKTEPAECRTGC